MDFVFNTYNWVRDQDPVNAVLFIMACLLLIAIRSWARQFFNPYR